jgi:hypothetical protein
MPSHPGQTRGQPRDEKGRLLPKPPPAPPAPPVKLRINPTASAQGYSGGHPSRNCPECDRPEEIGLKRRECGTCHRPYPEADDRPADYLQNRSGPF